MMFTLSFLGQLHFGVRFIDEESSVPKTEINPSACLHLRLNRVAGFGFRAA